MSASRVRSARSRCGSGTPSPSRCPRGLLDEQVRHRLADDVRAADDDHVCALGLHVGGREELLDAVGRTGLEAGVAGDEAADVLGVEAVDVLRRVDGAQDRPVLDVVGDRHLDENAVDILVGVEVLDGVVQFGGVRVGVESMSMASIPTSSQSSCFIETYVSLAGSSVISTVASDGRWPASARRSMARPARPESPVRRRCRR